MTFAICSFSKNDPVAMRFRQSYEHTSRLTGVGYKGVERECRSMVGDDSPRIMENEWFFVP
jgi:hypothetical protein